MTSNRAGDVVAQEPFPAVAGRKLADRQLRANLRRATQTIRDKRLRVVGELPAWAALRVAGAAIKDDVLARLPELLEQFEARATAAGATVHWARDAVEAAAVVTDLVRGTTGLRGTRPAAPGHRDLRLSHLRRRRHRWPIPVALLSHPVRKRRGFGKPAPCRHTVRVGATHPDAKGGPR